MTRIKRRLESLWKRAQKPGRWATHPEDKKKFRDGVRDGKRYAPMFARVHAAEMTRLIATFADDDAAEQLAALREAFWAQNWKWPVPASGEDKT